MCRYRLGTRCVMISRTTVLARMNVAFEGEQDRARQLSLVRGDGICSPRRLSSAARRPVSPLPRRLCPSTRHYELLGFPGQDSRNTFLSRMGHRRLRAQRPFFKRTWQGRRFPMLIHPCHPALRSSPRRRTRSSSSGRRATPFVLNVLPPRKEIRRRTPAPA